MIYDMVFRGTSSTSNRVVAALRRGIYVGSFSANSSPPVTNTDSITLAKQYSNQQATSVLSNDFDADGDTWR